MDGGKPGAVGSEGCMTWAWLLQGMDGGKPGAVGGEGVLANFFNSLLSKKTGTSPGATPKSAGESLAPVGGALPPRGGSSLPGCRHGQGLNQGWGDFSIYQLFLLYWFFFAIILYNCK